MIDPKILDDLSKRVAEGLPAGLQAFQADIQKLFRSAFERGLSRMDLVTRQEFDVQSGVLARTREKVERLEQQLRELEARVSEGP
ncbi:MAG: accessory factor UbiK family protein [Gammaproteobacteria bacterium]|nr:accessory factor UbiK family protein [Gammaproteobacteria bacterium]